MFRFFILAALFLVPGFAQAQPGGGGGLQIKAIYNSKLQKLDLATDSLLEIRTFVLRNGTVQQETFLHQQLVTNAKKAGQPAHCNWQINLPSRNYTWGYQSHQSRSTDQRIVLVYQSDTMVVDILDIIGENAMGLSDHIDSLVIQTGKYIYNREERGRSGLSMNSELLRHGLTPTTVKNLANQGRIKFDPKADLSFLKEQNLSAGYFLKRAHYYLLQQLPEKALADLNMAIAKNNGHKTCETLLLLSNVFSVTNQPAKAVEAISDAMDCGKEYWPRPGDNYNARAGLYAKAGQLEKALEDYNKYVELSQSKQAATITKAQFRAKYQADYTGAIADLSTFISTIPENHLADRPQGTSEYVDSYFVLGQLEFWARNKQASYSHWLKAMEFGYGQSSDDNTVVHFDSLLYQNRRAPELFAARGIAHFRRAAYVGGGANTYAAYDNALNDLRKAEELGLKTYTVYLFTANALLAKAEHKTALKQINKAISLNNKDPRAYLVRYQIKNRLGRVKNQSNSHPDMAKYRELSKAWRWEK